MRYFLIGSNFNFGFFNLADKIKNLTRGSIITRVGIRIFHWLIDKETVNSFRQKVTRGGVQNIDGRSPEVLN